MNRGEKVGLVGPNGAGKTTIFRLITREEEPDDGQVAVDRGVTHRLLQPGRRRDEGQERRRGDARRRRARSRRRRASCTSSSTRSPTPTRADELEALVERFGEAQARFEELGGYGLESRAREVLAGLGFAPDADGRRRRRALGRLEDARRPRAHPGDAARRAAARRAHQPPRPRVDPLARGLAARLRGRAA